jgi:hypothetical protein
MGQPIRVIAIAVIAVTVVFNDCVIIAQLPNAKRSLCLSRLF